jgi:hypothetical protein
MNNAGVLPSQSSFCYTSARSLPDIFLWFNLSYYLRQVTVVNYPLLFSVCNVLALLLETHSGVVSVISPRKL